jgi:hypothetical protein
MTHGRSRTRDHQLIAMDGRPVSSSASGRVCAEDACATRLSIYNHTTFCSIHGRPTGPKVNNVLWAR